MDNESTFEEKLNTLEGIVKELETGNIDLDLAINKYTLAMKLAKECSDKLNKATEQINKVLLENGQTETFDINQKNED